MEFKELSDLLPSLILQKYRKLQRTIENWKRVTTETQSELTKLDLLNRNFNDTIKIKKNQERAGLILLHNSGESFVTRYKCLQ